jgi:glycosyltransferase involved in cell wall biosynthesis
MSRLKIPLLMAGPLGWLYDEEEELLAIIGRRYGQEFDQDILGGKVSGLTTQPSPQRSAKSQEHDPRPVRHLGYLPRRHVTALLQCAKFFVFPSLYEGFGLPTLEAMQLRVPVLTSRTGSLCEVVGEAAFLVNPLDIDDIAHGIRQLDADSDLRAELARRGPVQAAKFSEEAYIQRLKGAYAKVGVSFQNNSISAKPQAAVSA